MVESQTLPHGYRLLDTVVIGDAVDLGAATVSYSATDDGRPVRVEEYFPARLARRADGVAVVPDAVAIAPFQTGLAAFTEAARGLARIRHPAIVGVRRWLVANGTCYLVACIAEGETLAERLGGDRSMTPEELERMVTPVLDGLAVAHRGGLLHRQIAPTAVVLRSDGTGILTNFSLDAKTVGGARQTFAGGGSGQVANVKPGYAALEQYSAGGRVGPWTDVYGLGALLYRCATGRPPADAPRRAVRDDLQPTLAILREARYERIAAAIDAALALPIAKRPQSVDHWRAMLVGRARLSPADNRAGRTSARGFGRAVPVSASASPVRGSGARGGADVSSQRSLPGVRWVVPALAAAGLTVLITWVDTGVLRGDGLGSAEGGHAPPVVPGIGGDDSFADSLDTGGNGPPMIVLPAGTQRAACVGDGCPDAGARWREVTLAAPIAMSMFEVTALDYAAFAADTGRPVDAVSGVAGRLPVVNVSWEDAVAYARWLAAQTSQAYRLPTEAEWDYAAGAGDGGHTGVRGALGVSPVGSGSANARGLHDLHHNVSEWVLDCADAEELPTCESRIRRGSSWIHPTPNAGAAMRSASHVRFRAADTGFRVVRVLN